MEWVYWVGWSSSHYVSQYFDVSLLKGVVILTTCMHPFDLVLSSHLLGIIIEDSFNKIFHVFAVTCFTPANVPTRVGSRILKAVQLEPPKARSLFHGKMLLLHRIAVVGRDCYFYLFIIVVGS